MRVERRYPGTPGTAGLRFAGSVLAAAGVLLIGIQFGCGDAGEEMAETTLRAIDQGKITGTRGTMEALGRALQAYAVDKSEYPRGGSLADAMEALVPAHLRAPVEIDAWGRAFTYEGDGESYTLTSAGPDGRFGSGDDIVLIDGRFSAAPGADGG